MARGAARACPGAQVLPLPIADGGDDTLDVLVEALGGTLYHARVTGPLGEPVRARYGWVAGERLAIVETAAASGLRRVPPGQRNPLRTTTRGTGELMRAALGLAPRRLLLAVGGSATVDGGLGALLALGARVWDRSGSPVGEGGAALSRIAKLDLSKLDPRLAAVRLEVACDVANPLLGPRGAARVYGPQKGASEADVLELERGLTRWAALLRSASGRAVAGHWGAGAAGGLPAGLAAACDAKLRPGGPLVLEALAFAERVEQADLLLVGEGQLDGTSAFGKAPVAAARLARGAGIPAIAICGALGPGWERTRCAGIRAAFALAPGPAEREASLGLAATWLERATAQAVAAFVAGRGGSGSTTRPRGARR